MSVAHAQRTYADSGAEFLESAAGKLLTSIERQAREMLETAQAEAAEIARVAEEEALKLLGEASRTMSDAEKLLDEADRMKTKLKRRYSRAFRGRRNAGTTTQDGIEKLCRLYGDQQAKLERVGAARLADIQLWVHDQNEALAFYTQKLGMEVRADVTFAEMGDFRWLAVGPIGEPDVAIVLMSFPGPPVMDPRAAERVQALMSSGFAGTIVLATDDCHAAYEELKARGVEFIEPPQESHHGVDSSFRDPSGNHIRLTQMLGDGSLSRHPRARRARQASRFRFRRADRLSSGTPGTPA
jgi:catechol 2,3-dioxygenase-like lactoylglutathione lyase family enzyme